MQSFSKSAKPGDKFGRWEFIERVIVKANNNGGKQYKWKCRCECGTIKEIFPGSIKHGSTSCGCSRKQIQINRLWKGCGELGGFYLARVRKCSKRRGLECNITTEYLWSLYQNQKGKCALSGIDIYLPGKGKIKCNINQMTASLDRINPSIGYVEGNLRWVHKDINRIRQYFTDEQFLYYIKNIYEYQHNILRNV